MLLHGKCPDFNSNMVFGQEFHHAIQCEGEARAKFTICVWRCKDVVVSVVNSLSSYWANPTKLAGKYFLSCSFSTQSHVKPVKYLPLPGQAGPADTICSIAPDSIRARRLRTVVHQLSNLLQAALLARGLVGKKVQVCECCSMQLRNMLIRKS